MINQIKLIAVVYLIHMSCSSHNMAIRYITVSIAVRGPNLWVGGRICEEFNNKFGHPIFVPTRWIKLIFFRKSNKIKSLVIS